MPGQASPPSNGSKGNGNKGDAKKESNQPDEAQEKEKRDQADLVTIEIAERQLAILAPQGNTEKPS
jgi:hypothetical protein